MNPLHLVLRFHRLGHALLFGKLTDEQIEHLLRVTVDLGEICVQFPAEKEFVVHVTLMFFQECRVPLSPYADLYFFFSG